MGRWAVAALESVSKNSAGRQLILDRDHVGLLFLKPADQFVIRRTGDHAVKLRAEIVDHTNFFGDHIVDLPLLADQLSLVVDRQLLTFGGEYLAVYFGKRAIGSFADVDDFLIGVGLYDASVLTFEQLSE